MNHQLQANQIAKQYKKRRVVEDVSITVNSGEVVGLLGPNGAGKTTTFYMITGLIACDEGNIWLNDTELTQLPLHARAKVGIGYLPQEASVFRKLSSKNNILAVLELRKDLTAKQREDKCQQLLEELNITHIADSLGQSLSGGERRRVEIARALAMEPKFILLDEPFAGVDPISVSDIQKIIQQLSARQIGVLITDHNVREILGVCDRAYILFNGQILAQGTPEEVQQNQQVKQVYLGENFQ